MHHSFVPALAFGLVLAGSAPGWAQSKPVEAGAERYSFQPTERGVMRLDSRTGEVSVCASADAGVTCRVAPDERSALEAEIARLETENATLRKALADRSMVSPPPVPPAPIPPESAETSPPAGADPAEASRTGIAGHVETAWRHLLAMMARLKGAVQNGP